MRKGLVAFSLALLLAMAAFLRFYKLEDQGVREGETIADQLSARLRQKVRMPVELINLGVPGYNTTQEYWTFKERALPLKPQVCLMLYYVNDTEPPIFQISGNTVISPDLRTGIVGDLLAAARKRSALYNLVWTPCSE